MNATDTTRLLLAFLAAEEAADAWIKANPSKASERLTAAQIAEWRPLSWALVTTKAALLDHARAVRAGKAA